MKGLGQALGVGAESFARGAQLGQGLVDMRDRKELLDEERAWGKETRERQRQDWQHADEDRVRETELQQLNSLHHLMRKGVFDRATPRGQQTVNYIRNLHRALSAQGRGELDDQTLADAMQSFNQRHVEDVNKGTGVPTESDIDIGGGKVLPKGSRILEKQISHAFPNAGGNILLGIRSEAETPRGEKMAWENFVTRNRSSSPDDPAKPISVQELLRSLHSDAWLLNLVESEGQDEALAWIESQILARGGEVPERKIDTRSYQEGDKEVTEFVDEFGRVVDKKEGPKWEPQKPPQPTDDMREYDFAVSQGYKGSFLDFQKARQKGMALRVNPDGSVEFSDMPGGMTNPVRTQVQKDLIEAQDSLAKLRGLGPKISADYLTYVGRGKAAFGGVQDKLGFRGDTAKFNAERSAALQEVDQWFNAYRKLITGAAAAEKELEQLKKAVINSELGPQEFEARYKGLIDIIQADIDRHMNRLGANNSSAREPGFREGQTATNPQTGERILFKGGQWTPAR
jgi:hypothetical protein